MTDHVQQPEKKRRTVYTETEKRQLEEAFRNGMTSKCKSSAPQIQTVAEETGLHESQIKDWIGNKGRKVSGRKYQPNPSYHRPPNSFNMFCKEQSTQGNKNMASWSERWRQLGAESRATFRLQADGKKKT